MGSLPINNRNSNAPPLEKKKYLWLIISVCATAFMARMDIYSVSISLPTISRYFNINTSVVSLVPLCYFLFLSSSLLIFGKLEDKVGFRKVFILGYSLFIAGAFLCGISPHIFMLVFSRCVQGVGAAMLISSAYAIIPRFIPRGGRGRVFGLVAAASGIGITAGAPLGGLICGYLSWRGIFLINGCVGIIGLLAARKALPEKKPAAGEKLLAGFDFPGAIMSFFSILTLLFAINRGRELGWASPLVVSCFAFSALLCAAFIFREKKCRDPLLNIGLFKSARFSLTIIVSIIVYMVIYGTAFILPFYFELFEGLKPGHSGLLFLLYSLLYTAVSLLAGRASDRVSPRTLVTIAMILGTGACIFFSLSLETRSIVPAIIFLAWFGVTIGVFVSPNNYMVMTSAPAYGRGIISAVYRTSSNLGMALGACIFEAIFSSRVPHGNISPAGIKISPSVMAGGFRSAYQCAAVLFLVGLVISAVLLAKRKRRSRLTPT